MLLDAARPSGCNGREGESERETERERDYTTFCFVLLLLPTGGPKDRTALRQT